MNVARQSHQLRKRLERKYMRKALKRRAFGRSTFEEQFNLLGRKDGKDYMGYRQIPTH